MGAILAAVSLSESDALRRVFEGVVAMCIAARLVGGEAALFSAIDGAEHGAFIKAIREVLTLK